MGWRGKGASGRGGAVPRSVVTGFLCLLAGTVLAAPFAYVPNEESDTVTVIDTATDNVVATIPVGLNPIRLAVTPDGSKVYVACTAVDRVYVINTANNTVTKQIAVQDAPAEVLASPDGTRIYVPNSGVSTNGSAGESVSVIDVATDTVITNIPARANCRAIVWVQNSAGRFVYVANQGSANITVINHDTLTSPGNIPCGGGPRRLTVSPDGTRVYSANYQSDNVTAINAVTRQVLATIPVGAGPRGIWYNPNGTEVYVANLNTNFVSVIRTSNNTVSHTIPVGGGCWTVIVNSAGTRAYVVSSGDRTCYIIDTATHTVIDTAPIGVGSFWAKLNADESKLYITNPDSGPPGTVSVIDTASNNTIKTITCGSSPWIIDIQPTNTTGIRPGIRNATPTTVPRGCTVPITVFGSNFLAGITATISPAVTGLSVASTLWNNSTNITVVVTATTTASLSTTGFNVQNPNGLSDSDSALFTVTSAPTPTLTKSIPSAVSAPTNVSMQVYGTGIQNSATLAISPANSGATLSSVTVVNYTNLTLNLALSAAANTGTFGFRLTNPSGQSTTNASLFSITGGTPTLSSAVPNTVTAGSAVAMEVFGANFQSGATLTVRPTNAGIALSGIAVANSTNIDLTMTVAGTATTGTFGFIVQNPDGRASTNTSLYTILTALAPVPVRTVPSNIVAGSASAMSLFGSNFQNGATLTLTPANAGATFSGVTFVNYTNINLTFSTTGTATLGNHGFIVNNPDGKRGTNANLFAISAQPPALVRVTPTNITAGASAAMTVFGSNFISGATLVLSPANAGATLSAVTFVNATNLNVTVNTTTGAATGNHGFVVTNPDGKSATNSALFTITAPPPALSSAAPTNVVAGTSAPMSVFGQFFQAGATLVLSPANAGATLSTVTFVNATNLSVTVHTTTGAATGNHGFVVTNPDGKAATNSTLFAIRAPSPTLAGVAPQTVTNGTSVAMSVFGGFFQSGATLAVLPANAGVNLTGLTFVNATNLTVNVAVATNATTGVHGFAVTNPDGGAGTNSALFTILDAPPPPPTLSHAVPASVAASKTIAMNVYGTGFQPGASLALETLDAEIGLTGTLVVAPTNISVTVSVTSNATVGARGFIVTNPDTQSGTNSTMFTVMPVPLPPPVLLASTPASVVAGTTASLSIDATNLQPGATLALEPPAAGIVFSNVVIVSDVNLTVDVGTALAAPTGPRGFIVTNPDGESSTNTALFAIVPPPPALLSASPTNVPAAAVTTLNIFGTGLHSNATVALEPANAGVTVTNLVVVNSTNATVQLNVAPTPTFGAHGFIITNPDSQSGTNATLFEIVAAPPPVLLSASPANVTAGASAPMNVYGTGFQAGATLVLEPANAEVQLTGITIVNATNATLTVNVSSNSVTGAHGFIVTNADGQSATNAALFTILPVPPPPTLLSAEPNAVLTGTSGPMTLFGSNFVAGASASIFPANLGVGVSGVTVVTGTNITLNLNIASNADTGTFGFVVSHPNGDAATNATLFTISRPPIPPPVLNAVLPAQVPAAGTNITMTVFGANLHTNVALTLFPANAGMSLGSPVFVTDTNVTVTVNASGSATLGAQGLVATNPDGQAATNATLFTVVAPNVEPPGFTDVTSAAGVTIASARSRGNPVWGDLNNDSMLDFIVPTSSNNITVFLYRGDGTFSNFTAKTRIVAGATTIDSRRWFGLALADYDSDGNLDLFITEDTRQPGGGSKNDLLWRGYGTGEFSNVVTVAGVTNPTGRGSAATWVDYDGDGCLDLHILNFNSTNVLYAGVGCGTTTNRATAAGIATPLAAINASWADYDSDGLPDFAVTGAATNDFLFLNRGNGTFSNATAAAGLAGRSGGQGIAWGDYNNDGFVDVFIARGFDSSTGSNAAVQATLYRNNGNGTFSDVSAAAGVVATNNNWAGVWGDYDNDGWLDLFVTAAGKPNATGNANHLFHNNRDGTFTDLAGSAGVAGLDNATFHVGTAWADYDNDGFLDLVVKNGVGTTAQGLQLFRNQGNANKFMKLVLRSTTGQRDALGAVVQVTAGALGQVRQVTGGGGGELYSQGSTPVHFGLGTNAAVTVDVLWPDGTLESFGVLPANATYLLLEGTAGQPAAPAPLISTVSPTNVNTSSRTSLSVTGANIQVGATAVVTPTGTGARVDRVNFLGAAVLSLELMVDSNAVVGSRGLLITNPDGQAVSASPVFSIITLPPPVINTVTPATVSRNTTVTLTVAGSGFQPGITATIPNPRGVTITQVNFVDSSTIQITVSVSNSAQRTSRNLTVQNPDGQQTTKTAAFAVN